jgi:hypothetical protein
MASGGRIAIDLLWPSRTRSRTQLGVSSPTTSAEPTSNKLHNISNRPLKYVRSANDHNVIHTVRVTEMNQSKAGAQSVNWLYYWQRNRIQHRRTSLCADCRLSIQKMTSPHGASVFEYCSLLQSICLRSSVEIIWDFCFANYQNLTILASDGLLDYHFIATLPFKVFDHTNGFV